MKTIWQRAALAGWLLFLSACNLNEASIDHLTPDAEGMIYVTATPELPTPDHEGVIIITATPDLPTPNAQGQIIVTATIDPFAVVAAPELPVAQPATSNPLLALPPDEELEAANRYLINGQYEEAVAAYQDVLARGNTVQPALRADAAFSLGQAAIREGLFTSALSALDIFLSEFSTDNRVAQAHFLRGDAYLGLSRWQEAIVDFEAFLALRPGLIDSYAYERIADAQLALNQQDAAIASYTRAIEAQRTLVPLLVLREKAARILLGAGRLEDALAQYDAILELARNAPYRASIELLAAQALLNAGDNERALARARRIFDTYGETRPAYDAMQILLQNNVTIDGWQRGRVAYRYGDYAGAIAAFNDYSSNFTLDAIPAELYLLLGRAYREIGSSDAALIAFETVITQYPGDVLFGDALLEQGRTRFLAGDITGAITTYLSIADRYGYLARTAAEALWRAGYLYGTNGDPVRSREIFVRMAQEYPNDEWTINGLFLAASAAVNNNEPAVAENLYGRIAALAQGENKAAAYFWVGRLAEQRGDSRGASEAYDLTISAAPDSYFAARAGDIRAGRTPFEPPARLQFVYDEAAGRAETEDWLRRVFSISDPGPLSGLSTELNNDPRMVRGRELWAVAAYDEALTEFRALLDEMRENRNALQSYQMAIYLRDIGAYLSSIVAAADVINAAGVGTLEAPRYIARMRYPAYYVDLIEAQATRYGFDPLLLLGLIRQESLFNTNAESVATAKGLTQVMPATAQYIANQLAWPNYQVSHLYRPYVGIAFGAFYLDEQIRLFQGDIPAALAAYNAGPGRALDWARIAGRDVDLLVTTITIEETRSYIQRIYSHYNIYRTLYDGT